ncbi:MAG: hypothetical protein B9S36_07885 [Verrucomicrobiia bacterium Tous-C2TDCM]|nr:MAG: hypothetical protein B9S36_07885 [Verrucomicrobiae bacterium Tous-C2TDCM]
MNPFRLFPLALLSLFVSPLAAAELSIDRQPDGVVIKIDGELFTKYVTGDPKTNKPYFYPVIGPGGEEMTRSYPMRDVEGEAQDHPHHRSLWFGHQFVNDFDTWHEGLTMEERAKGDEKKLAEMMAKLGVTKHREVLEAKSEGGKAVLKVASDYLDPSGVVMVTDVRTFTFSVAADGSRLVDADLVFTGVADSVTFADAKDAGLSLRVAHSMAVKSAQGGRIVLSTGEEGEAAWGKRAEWCDFNGPVRGKGGELFGIAVLNHPSSLRHPTPWHARTYGLLTANPFGMKSVAGAKEESPVVLKKGESFALCHRIVLHRGDEKQAKIADLWKSYSAE